MISNITLCCKKCFYPNETFYVQVKNNYDKYIYIQLIYALSSKLVKKQSPVFKPGTLQHLTFPKNATGTMLRIFDASKLPPQLIWLESILTNMSKCFIITGHSIATSQCVEVPC